MIKIRSENEDYSQLAYIHHLLSGLKAVYTQQTYNTLSMLRESCGGAGFSSYSGLPIIVKDHSAQVAYEGDNTVMI